MLKISADIQNIPPYLPGKPIEELEREEGIVGAIKLASNENPLGASPKATAALRNSLQGMYRYPDGGCYYLKHALSDRWKVTPGQIVIGNGSNEIIELIVRTLILPGDEAVMAHPSFSLYSIMVQAGHGKTIRVPLRDGCHDLVRMAQAVTSKTKLIFICNPNNPTGTIVRKQEVELFLNRLPHHLLVVFDEAYAEYVTDPDFPSTIDYIRKEIPRKPAIMTLRTFSKIYGLAGLRVGYGLSRPDLIDSLNRVRQPFNVSFPAQQAALAALSDENHVAKSLKTNREGMNDLTRAFNRLGMTFLPSQANFVYFGMKSAVVAKGVYMSLLEKGVIIRYFQDKFLRVTIGKPSEMSRFIQALEEVLLR